MDEYAFSEVIERAVYQRLSTRTFVTALVPAIRIYLDDLPQSPILPAITFRLISDTAPLSYTNEAGPWAARIQVSPHASTKYAARRISERVKRALVGWRGYEDDGASPPNWALTVQGCFYVGSVAWLDPLSQPGGRDAVRDVQTLDCDFMVHFV
jgi:hypothetical protein